MTTGNLRALVVDDEAPARRRLAELLDALGVEVVGEAADGVTALDLARDRRPDVILLDVSMPEVDGFDVARHLADPRPLVIFQTAYSEFAVKAFEHDAIDYLVKPVSRDRLAQAVDRAQRRLQQAPGAAPSREQMTQFGTAIGHVPARPERLLVRHGAAHRLVPVADIERFTSDAGLIYAHGGGVHATDYTLNELEERFTGAFVRVSRADLVSLRHVTGIASNGDGSAVLTLTSGTRVHVSRRRAAAVRRVF